MICSHGATVAFGDFTGTAEDGELARMALVDFGHLIRGNAAFKRFTFAEFAQLIKSTYDVANPKTRYVVSGLRRIHRNQPVELEEAVQRWPRLHRAMQYAAILSRTEAGAALRDWHNMRLPYGGEAVNHYGGVPAVLAGAIRCRHIARRVYQK